MFKKKSIFCFLAFIISSNFLFADTVPDKFYIKERWFSLTTTFDIKDDTQNLGVVYRKFFSLLPEYHLEDVYGQLQAKARMRFFALGAKFDIYNNNNELLGLVDQKILRFFPTFEILSPSYISLAKAKLNFWGTKYTITDPLDDHIIATLSRPFLFLKTNWTMTIFDKEAIDEKNIHPHMLLVIAAFQVDSEYWQAQRNYKDYKDSKEKAYSTYNSGLFSNMQNQNDLHTISNLDYNLDGPENEKIISNYLLENLLAKKDQLSDVEIDESDFQYIENLTNVEKIFNNIYFSSDNEKFYEIAQNYIELLDTNELSQKQKKALYLMLEQRLKM